MQEMTPCFPLMVKNSRCMKLANNFCQFQSHFSRNFSIFWTCIMDRVTLVGISVRHFLRTVKNYVKLYYSISNTFNTHYVNDLRFIPNWQTPSLGRVTPAGAFMLVRVVPSISTMFPVLHSVWHTTFIKRRFLVTQLTSHLSLFWSWCITLPYSPLLLPIRSPTTPWL